METCGAEEPYEGNLHVRLCVQQRQTRSAGVSPAKVKARSLVARMAGRRETEFLKPIDKAIFGRAASHRAVAQAHTVVAPKVQSPGGRARNRADEGNMVGRTLAETANHSGGVEVTARGQGRVRQLEQPSSSHRAIDGAREAV